MLNIFDKWEMGWKIRIQTEELNMTIKVFVSWIESLSLNFVSNS